mmetsp:Transcript_2098/g.6508  ORF Transcript_2098/g.6508 Transcript_2098/m.6508 type:complete len:205 (-) Transcript_2098:431-1045(-)
MGGRCGVAFGSALTVVSHFSQFFSLRSSPPLLIQAPASVAVYFLASPTFLFFLPKKRNPPFSSFAGSPFSFLCFSFLGRITTGSFALTVFFPSSGPFLLAETLAGFDEVAAFFLAAAAGFLGAILLSAAEGFFFLTCFLRLLSSFLTAFAPGPLAADEAAGKLTFACSFACSAAATSICLLSVTTRLWPTVIMFASLSLFSLAI